MSKAIRYVWSQSADVRVTTVMLVPTNIQHLCIPAWWPSGQVVGYYNWLSNEEIFLSNIWKWWQEQPWRKQKRPAGLVWQYGLVRVSVAAEERPAAALGLLPDPRTTSLQSLQTPSPPPHSHSLAACRALTCRALLAKRAHKALQGSSALVDPEHFSLDAQSLRQIILVLLLLFMLCILLHCLAVFDTFWKCCQQGRNSPSHHLCHQLKAIVLLNPYYRSHSFHWSVLYVSESPCTTC